MVALADGTTGDFAVTYGSASLLLKANLAMCILSVAIKGSKLENIFLVSRFAQRE